MPKTVQISFTLRELVLKVTTTRSSHVITLGSNVTKEIEFLSYNVTRLRMDPNFIRWAISKLPCYYVFGLLGIDSIAIPLFTNSIRRLDSKVQITTLIYQDEKYKIKVNKSAENGSQLYLIVIHE